MAAPSFSDKYLQLQKNKINNVTLQVIVSTNNINREQFAKVYRSKIDFVGAKLLSAFVTANRSCRCKMYICSCQGRFGAANLHIAGPNICSGNSGIMTECASDTLNNSVPVWQGHISVCKMSRRAL